MNTTSAASATLLTGVLGVAMMVAMLPRCASAQEMDHSKMHMPMPAKNAPDKKAVSTKKTTSGPVAPARKPEMDHSKMDHSKMHMPAPAKPPAAKKRSPRKTATKPKPVPAVDHSTMGHDMPMPTTTPAKPVDHSQMGHDMGGMPGMPAASSEPVTPIPVLTDADRAAAVPPAHDHPVHDNSIQSYVLLDRLETWNADEGMGLRWEGRAWVGTDLNRIWLRSEGERVDARTESADIEVLYGHSVSPWWDLVAGIRHDFKPGAAQDFAAIGVLGLAPYKFEVAATAFLGESGQASARVEVEYETLLTNRLILQPSLEANLYGKDDARRGIGSGLGTVEAGLRLRYEFNRQFAPYIGIVRERAFGGTADLRRDMGEDVDDTRIVAGLRIWF